MQWSILQIGSQIDVLGLFFDSIAAERIQLIAFHFKLSP
jgi:hypothetical protein